MFERKVNINGEIINLQFRPFSKIPGRISRLYRRNMEEQLWQALAWGMVEPKSWPVVDDPAPEPVPEPVDGEPAPVPVPVKPKPSTAIWDGIFDDVEMDEITRIHNEWQRAADVTAGESDASNE